MFTLVQRPGYNHVTIPKKNNHVDKGTDQNEKPRMMSSIISLKRCCQVSNVESFLAKRNKQQNTNNKTKKKQLITDYSDAGNFS